MDPLQFPMRIRVEQVQHPLGVFYVGILRARVLLETAYSDRLKAQKGPDGQSYTLSGSQRELVEPRLREIAAYIDGTESTFPNSIILAANFDEESGQPEESNDLRWTVESSGDHQELYLTIPSDRKLAPIIDGQHRLFAFNYVEKERLDMPLVCSIFLDLPKPYQAFIFATINSTQRPVNKSLTYELFGYNIENEPPESWSPDKLAVFLARKLNSEAGSPLKRRILVVAENDFALTRSKAKAEGSWVVSMATVVQGIAKLYSQNPKRDGVTLLQHLGESRNRKVLKPDRSPMRSAYLNTNDKLIYQTVLNYLNAANKALWMEAKQGSFILKTIGIQAVFDVLRPLAVQALDARNIKEDFFLQFLTKASAIDFASEEFQNPSGSGRVMIRTALEEAMGLA